jgi:hypothetical protein
VKAADAFLAEPPTTVTAFKAEKSAGGTHDYFSQADYSWPDPAKPDGLPYVNRDGWSNPDTFQQHRWAMVRLARGVGALGAAFKLTGDPKYAGHALAHLRAWFVAPDTRMNPSLLYSQAILGSVTGRGVGIIDTIHLVEVSAAIEVLSARGGLAPADAADLHAAVHRGVELRLELEDEVAELLLRAEEAVRGVHDGRADDGAVNDRVWGGAVQLRPAVQGLPVEEGPPAVLSGSGRGRQQGDHHGRKAAFHRTLQVTATSDWTDQCVSRDAFLNAETSTVHTSGGVLSNVRAQRL